LRLANPLRGVPRDDSHANASTLARLIVG